MPKLGNVFGTATITSTGDISDSCPFFDTLAANKDIQGKPYLCTSNNAKANEGGDGGDSADSSSDPDDAASTVGMSVFALAAAVMAASLTIL